MKSGRLEQCLTRSCPDTGPHGANLTPARRSPTFRVVLLTASGAVKMVGHAATTSRSIVKLSGRSVVCWVPLGTPILPLFLLVADLLF